MHSSKLLPCCTLQGQSLLQPPILLCLEPCLFTPSFTTSDMRLLFRCELPTTADTSRLTRPFTPEFSGTPLIVTVPLSRFHHRPEASDQHRRGAAEEGRVPLRDSMLQEQGAGLAQREVSVQPHNIHAGVSGQSWPVQNHYMQRMMAFVHTPNRGGWVRQRCNVRFHKTDGTLSHVARSSCGSQYKHMST